MSNSTATQGELAEILRVSQGMVSRYIAHGKIPAHCLVKDGKYTRIKVDCAFRLSKAYTRDRVNAGALELDTPSIKFTIL